MNNISPSLHRAIADEVGSEQIVWSDAPEPWGYARRSWKTALFGIPFTTIAAVGAYFSATGVSKSGKPTPPFFVLWALIFVAIGLSMLLAPFFMAWKARRVAYVLTAKRAVIVEKVFWVKVTSYDASGLGGFERVSQGRAAGDIVFQRIIQRRGKGTQIKEVGFLGLRDFAPAESALRDIVARNVTPQAAK